MDQLNQLLDRIGALKTQAKLGLLIGVLAALVAGYYPLFYADLLDQEQQIDRSVQEAEAERQSYEQRKREYQAFRLEVNQLLEEQKELLRVLPKKDDIEQFIENVNAQVELAGLSKVASVREPAVPEEMYMRIPIRMSLIGGYHQINRFFKNIGELKRIVTITDLALATASTDVATAQGPLKAEFVAQTFQFVDKPMGAGPPAAQGAPR